MRRSTIVVAVFAATVASAGAAPADQRLARGAAVQSDSLQGKQTTSAGQAVSLRAVNGRAGVSAPTGAAHPGAAAFTSARNAPQPQSAVAAARPVPAVARPVRVASAKRHAPSRFAVRRLASRSRVVALQRDIAIPAPAVDAPTGSIPAMVTAEARRQGVSPALAHAVVKVESRYQPRATGKGGYVGLMQLSYRTARGMGFRGSRAALYEPSNNLSYGMRYLAQAVKLSGGETCAAVSKYQGGHGVRGVTSAGAVYCAKVKRFMAQGYSSGAKADRS